MEDKDHLQAVTEYYSKVHNSGNTGHLPVLNQMDMYLKSFEKN
jgi:hypothetical protein